MIGKNKLTSSTNANLEQPTAHLWVLAPEFAICPMIQIGTAIQTNNCRTARFFLAVFFSLQKRIKSVIKMILVVSNKICGSANMLMDIFAERKIPAFRFNLDMFNKYCFQWKDDEFEIIDPTGRCCKSEEIKLMIFYKGLLPSEISFENDLYTQEKAWLISWLNKLYDCIVCYGKEKDLIRLWNPFGYGIAKTLQMKIAKKYFEVPEFRLHWGTALSSRKIIAKPLTQKPLANCEMIYAKIVDRADLDPSWPWFTQEIADGNRDATVLYINEKVHCYQFATERGNLTDWRITQGTNDNQWIPWDAGSDFEKRIDLYMKDMGLKYGRLDFIIGGKEPQFLEVNPEGQFGWLDDENGLPLHNEVVDAILDPATTIEI